jgi:DNA polymerase-3 subunit alpha
MIVTDSYILNNESLHNWIENNQLTVIQTNNKVLQIEGVGKFLLIEQKTLVTVEGTVDNKIFDHDFQIPLNDEENEYSDNVDYLLFQFGDRWYYTDSLTPQEIKEFKYIGKPNLTFSDTKMPYLGVHGGFELCNGSREYKSWIKKAKFLNIDALGLAEENTLAGSLAFQEECLKSKIKGIIGETITVLTDTKGRMNIKLYVHNEEGWKNLLLINKIINVDNDGDYIKEEQLLNTDSCTKGLICVLSPDIDLEKHYFKFKHIFHSVYYQIDFVEWASGSRDEQWLKSLQNYFDNYMYDIEPILICDAYYLDKDDHDIKKILNNIGKTGFRNNSKDQYFKSVDDIYLQAGSLFKEDDERWQLILEWGIDNANKICNEIDFKIPVGFFRLPKYELAEGDQAVYSTPENLFFELIEKGFQEKIIDKDLNATKYADRLQEEIEVIQSGGFVDYFMILWDVLNWCRINNIWYGIGRGSAAGSLVSYLLGIVGIDPILYGLKFSRFLNAGRIGKSLPDIDLDFQGEKRDEVKRYIESKYGTDYVTAIGTYSTFKSKGAIKDLAREFGIDYSKTNFITSLLPKVDEVSFTGLFKDYGATNDDFKKYIQKNYKLFEKLPLVLNQAKTASIHPSGVVIVPKQYGSVYEQMPIKKIDGVLVSEWEGEWIDKAGFLKCDILGVKQLDKIAAIAKLVKENTGDVIEFDKIELHNEEVFDLFREGHTEDVFQFGTAGLKAYCKEMKPDNINDLIAAVALYRPGTMDNGLHKKYIKIKHGSEKPVYDDGTFEATKETYGIAVYQEQVMQICVDVAGFNEVEADDVRKAMGKKDKELLDKQKEKFIDGAVKRGFDKDNCDELWTKLETFSGYGFNKSHAAAYAITGYYTQWLKWKYPIEFWTVSLEYSDEEDMINRISEINRISSITLASVNINHSTKKFFAEKKKKTIYWAINSVKWVGDKAVDKILAEREKNGEFFSIEDFCDRVKAGAVNKRVIVNLILSGAFDKIENINPEERFLLIKKFFTFTSQTIPEDLQQIETWKDYQYTLKQKELSGYGYVDFKKIVKSSSQFAAQQKKFKDNADILFSNNVEMGDDIVVAGVLKGCYEREWKRGGSNKLAANLEIMDNENIIRMCIWRDHYETVKDALAEGLNRIVIISGKIAFDAYRNCPVVHSRASTRIEVI